MGLKKIEVICPRCGKVRLYAPCHAKKLKTNLCKSCMLSERNSSPEMREISRQNGSRPKNLQTREKLSEAQKQYWTEERKESRSGKGNPSWRGGRAISTGGYILIRAEGHPRATQKGHYVFEHIIIAERELGRLLRDDEVIHHINGNRQDNRSENLSIMTPSDHATYHNQERKNE